VVLIRYDGAGVLDAGFGNAGMASAPITGSASANAVGILSDGRIVIAGNVTLASGQQRIFIARYFGDAP
jgi:hypothetical protein